MKPSTFLTRFWILYFPLCIAYYDYVNDYVDEIMTLILVLFTFAKKRSKHINRNPLKETLACFGILTFYLVYSLIRQVNVPIASVIDFQQQIRPYAVFFCTWILAPQFSRSQKKWMLVSIILTFVSYTIINRRRIGEEENVVFGALAMSTALTYYLFTKSTKRNRNIAIFIAIIGLLCGKFKYFGEATAFIAVLLLLKKKLRLQSIKPFLQIATLGVIILFFTWERFDAYFVTGLDNDNLARTMMYRTMPKIIADYIPFGPGLATFGTSASAKTYYSDLYYEYGLSGIWGMAQSDRGAFNADSFYPSMAQFGIIGIFLFLWFWKRRIKDMDSITDFRCYKTALCAILCLAIESIADTSYLSGRGMAYFMLIAICLNSNKYDIEKRE